MTTVIEKCDCGYIFIDDNICYILFVVLYNGYLEKLKFRNYLNSLLYGEELS